MKWCSVFVCVIDKYPCQACFFFFLFFFYRFAVATPEELAVNNDDCAICWDSMQAARKLPCGHLFHK